MLYHAHSVLIQGKREQVLCSIMEEIDGILKGKGLDDLLNEVSGVVVPA